MKKMIMAMFAAFMLSNYAMAQDEKNSERQQPSMEQMAQRRTDEMTKKYNLTEEQSAKLLELNKKYADMRPMGPRLGHRQGMRSPEGKRQHQAPDSLKQTRMKGAHTKVNFQEMKKKMEEYNAQLQTILTEEQYAAYKSDREKMMRRGPRQGRNQHNNNDNK